MHTEIANIVAYYPAPTCAPMVRHTIAQGILKTFGTCRVLSIDAWREPDGGWTWNDWRECGRFPLALLELSPRALLREMRERGFLSAASAGRVGIEDDGYNITITQRSNGMPLFAIAYGEEYI